MTITATKRPFILKLKRYSVIKMSLNEFDRPFLLQKTTFFIELATIERPSDPNFLHT